MKIRAPWSPDLLQVYAISWSRHNKEYSVLEDRTSFSVLEGDNLTDIYEHECSISSYDLDEFCLMPKSFDDRFLVLMWKPLAESGIWQDLREFDKAAMKRFGDIRLEYGHTDVTLN
jgi:hypothetical protein